MNSRMFKTKTSRFWPNVAVQHIAKHHSSSARPPVLLLGEVHTRPNAKIAIYNNLSDLKQRGYDTLMTEGIKGGNTLEEELSREHLKKFVIRSLSDRIPQLKELMKQQYQLTQEDFDIACEKILNSASPSLNYSKKTVKALTRVISNYAESDIAFFERLISMNFSFENLDKNTTESVLRPCGSRSDMFTRDAQYAWTIGRAYKEGKNVISILGGAHVLPDPELTIYDEAFGQRQLLGDRLREQGIPSITLFPFNSSHTPAIWADEAWEKQSGNSSGPLNSSSVFSVDIKESGKQFLEMVDTLSSRLNDQSVDNNLQAEPRRNSR